MPAPTGSAAYDLLLVIGATAVLAWACWAAPRWTWFVIAVVGAAFVETAWLPLVAGIAALAIVGFLMDRLRLPIAILIAVASMVALCNFRSWGFVGLPTLLAFAAVLPTVAIAAYFSTARTWLLLRLGIAAVALVTAVGIGVAVTAAVLVQGSARDAIDTSKAAVDAARDGDTARAAELFGQAETEFTAVTDRTDAWWVRPARLVPIVSQHLEVIDTLAADGARIAATAAGAVEEADIDKLQPRAGAVDLDAVATMTEPLAAMRTILETTRIDIADVASPWLVPPVADRLGEVTDEIDAVLPDVEIAIDAVDAIPGLLGEPDDRRYLVLFGQIAELRDGGGIIASWAELVARDGRIVVTEQGSNDTLNERLIDAPVPDAETYPKRLIDYQVQNYMQNWVATPDFPTTARLAASLYERATRRPIDGVIYLDAVGVAALLAVAGPVEVDRVDEPLTTANVVEFLNYDQYVEFPDRAERKDFLVEIGTAAFERLLVADLPEPRVLIDSFRSAIGEDHLNLWTFDPAEQEVLRTADLDGALPEPGGNDVISLRVANNGADKLDAHIAREASYEIEIDPDAGEVRSTVSVTFTNLVPDDMPFPVVEFPPAGLPVGTASLIVSLYSSSEVTGIRIGGTEPVTDEGTDGGYQRSSVYLDLQPGMSRTIVFRLRGDLPTDASYQLDLLAQATVLPEDYTANLTFGGVTTTFRGTLDEDQVLAPDATAHDL